MSAKHARRLEEEVYRSGGEDAGLIAVRSSQGRHRETERERQRERQTDTSTQTHREREREDVGLC